MTAKLLRLSFAASLASFASASVLTFDFTPTPALNSQIDSTYGDRVTAATMGGFSYGAAGGFTPNVELSYGPASGNFPGGCPFDANGCVYFWDNDFGDLTNVAAQSAQSGANYGLLELLFTTDAGFQVNLDSFDLGGWPSNGGVGRPASFTINSVAVFDAGNNVLFSQNNVVVPVTAGGRVSFSPNVSGSSLRLVIDAGNLTAGNGANIGIDNVQFSQTDMPEPATSALIALGLGAVAIRKFRR